VRYIQPGSARLIYGLLQTNDSRLMISSALRHSICHACTLSLGLLTGYISGHSCHLYLLWLQPGMQRTISSSSSNGSPQLLLSARVDHLCGGACAPAPGAAEDSRGRSQPHSHKVSIIGWLAGGSRQQLRLLSTSAIISSASLLLTTCWRAVHCCRSAASL
jgi:hypothetical protein